MGDYVPQYTPGMRQTAVLSVACTGGQLLFVSATGTVAPTTAATANTCGVAAQDGAIGAKVALYAGGVQLLAATGTVTAGQTVEAATAGTVATHTNGTNDVNIVGVALTTAVGPALVQVLMNR